MSTPNGSAPVSLVLTWQHGLGSLSAFFAGLERGVIVASRCKRCGHTTVPLRGRCPYDGAETHQLELPPVGVVFGVTTGAASRLLDMDAAETVFAEVQVQGSDNRILARIDPAGGAVSSGSRVVLVQRGSQCIHPVQHLVFMADQEDEPDKSGNAVVPVRP